MAKSSKKSKGWMVPKHWRISKKQLTFYSNKEINSKQQTDFSTQNHRNLSKITIKQWISKTTLQLKKLFIQKPLSETILWRKLTIFILHQCQHNKTNQFISTHLKSSTGTKSRINSFVKECKRIKAKFTQWAWTIYLYQLIHMLSNKRLKRNCNCPRRKTIPHKSFHLYLWGPNNKKWKLPNSQALKTLQTWWNIHIMRKKKDKYKWKNLKETSLHQMERVTSKNIWEELIFLANLIFLKFKKLHVWNNSVCLNRKSSRDKRKRERN